MVDVLTDSYIIHAFYCIFSLPPKEFVRFIKPREIVPTVYSNTKEREATCKRFGKFVNIQALKRDFITKMRSSSSFPSPSSSSVDVESSYLLGVSCEERECDDSLSHHHKLHGGGTVSHDQCDVSSPLDQNPNLRVDGSVAAHVKKKHYFTDPMDSKLLKDGEWACEVQLHETP